VPELPEVETIRRQLAPVLLGRRIEAAGGHASPKFATASEATGATVAGVRRRGKYLLVDLDHERELVIHLGMTGRIRLRSGGSGATVGSSADPYLRAWWQLEGDEVLELADIRRFGRVAVVAQGDYASLPTLAALGPEPLTPDFTPDGFYDSLHRSGVRLKTQLLNQRVVAGVGNIYADEALWAGGIDPATRRLSRRRAAALHDALRDVLARGIANGGTTLRDYRTFSGATGRNQHELRCYGRAGQECRRCGTQLRRRLIDGRSTTSCPSCQRR
jgi:formamidopyrimidine-DNA glycosylase